MKGLLKRALLAGLLAGTVQAQTVVPVISAQDFFDQVVYRLAQYYHGPSSLRIADLRDMYVGEVSKLCAGKPQTCDSPNAYPLVRRMLKQLGDPHTSLWVASDMPNVETGASQQEVPYFGFRSKPLGAGRIITELIPDSPAAKAGLKPGDLLLKVGEQTVQDIQWLNQAALKHVSSG